MHKNRKRICIVAPSLNIVGGHSVQAELLLEHFGKDGYDIHLFPIDVSLPRVLSWCKRVKFLRTITNEIFYIIKLLLHLRKIDVVHVFSAAYFSFILAPVPAIIISKLYGKRVILNYHSGHAKGHLKKWFWVINPFFNLVDRFVVPSDYLKDVFAEFGLKASVIFNIVDIAQFRFKSRTRIKANMLVTRGLKKVYNIPCIIHAFNMVKKRFPDSKLIVVGDGEEKLFLKRLVEDLKLPDVEFVGRIDHELISSFYEKSDIFLNSSDVDNMPLTILEAFASGLPVVSTNAGGIPYIVKDGENGLLVNKGDFRGLADKVIYLLKNPQAAQRLAEKARKDCEKYSWSAVKAKWLEVYDIR